MFSVVIGAKLVRNRGRFVVEMVIVFDQDRQPPAKARLDKLS